MSEPRQWCDQCNRDYSEFMTRRMDIAPPPQKWTHAVIHLVTCLMRDTYDRRSAQTLRPMALELLRVLNDEMNNELGDSE